ncbi:hypothetical protein J23TS9_47340 [Paenibacillus sp. J23TS9]|nr:hypothetical protein J23TS9_47340 [Paenibacillus sp. J23TS9]
MMTASEEENECVPELRLIRLGNLQPKSAGSAAAGRIRASKNRLGWRDDKHNLYYEIYDNLGSKLTKQDFVKLAEDMIASH